MSRFYGSLVTMGELFDSEKHQAYCVSCGSGLWKEQVLQASGKSLVLDRATIDEMKHEEQGWWEHHSQCCGDIIVKKPNSGFPVNRKSA